MKNEKNREEFRLGLKNGTPIGLAYFAVAFTFGIMAVTKGLSVFQAVLDSFLNLTSTGQFAALTTIASDGSYVEIMITTLVINLRYSLMSFTMSQKLEDGGHRIHRYLVAFGMTDEIFGISVNRPGKANPYYHYGAMVVSLFGWTFGTFVGAVFGNILPDMFLSALSVAIYAMFLAIIIPPAEDDHFLYFVILFSMLASAVFAYAPVLRTMTSGFSIIIITVVVSLIAAVIRPIPSPMED